MSNLKKKKREQKVIETSLRTFFSTDVDVPVSSKRLMRNLRNRY